MCTAIHMLKPTEYAASTVNTSVNYVLWITVTCQCRSIGCKKYMTLMKSGDGGRVWDRVGYEILSLYSILWWV